MKTRIFTLLAAMLLTGISAFAQSNAPLKGDVNEDGKVDVADIACIIDIMANGQTEVETEEYETFKTFSNFQGYIEEIYSLIPDKQKVDYNTAWNLGDDAVHNPEGYALMDHQVDLGNYRNWLVNKQCWLNGEGNSLWKNAWYCIHKCNLGIEQMKTLSGTDEERDLLLGQLYFFRAWWHFELMCYFGGLPYVDRSFGDKDLMYWEEAGPYLMTLDGNKSLYKGYRETSVAKIPELPRLSFQECADRCAADFEKAYSLLPLDWNETRTGFLTYGQNQLRVNKFMALCYLGKCYLWAGSPLMKEFEKTKNGGVAELLGASSNGKTYDYDVEYCKKAAEALGKALDMVNKGQVSYALAEFDYVNIYDHERNELSWTNYSDVFYTTQQGWRMPGTTEAIFRGAFPGQNSANWNCAKTFGPKVEGLVAYDNIIHQPTANLIDQYGMANGQPIYLVQNGEYVLNPLSGWDPEHPYKDRDPRFYHDIVFDGFHYVLNTDALSSNQKKLEYCSLYTGGAMRDEKYASSTGYFIQKLVPHQCNEGDRWYDYPYAFQSYISYMRLADVYLMYAEALSAVANDASDLTESPEYCSLSAVDAINVLRDRVSSARYPLAHVQANLMDTREHFIDEVRRERAVELSFEGFRWCDLQRWLLLTEAPYTVKYAHEFDRQESDDWFKSHDPKDAKVGNFHKEELITRSLEAKHYWFPFPEVDFYLYEGFPQNPGW